MRKSASTTRAPYDDNQGDARNSSGEAPAPPERFTARRRRSLVGDVAAGLFLGDFATELGLPGAITQVTVSFVPLIGSACALRDLVADMRRRDHVGAALNALALTPILGGFSKTFEVIRSTAHVGHAMRSAHHQTQRRREEQARPTPSRQAQQATYHPDI